MAVVFRAILYVCITLWYVMTVSCAQNITRAFCNTSQNCSGVTKVGDTRGGNWGCHPLFFSWKTWRPFFSRQFVTPDFFFAKTDDLFLLIALSLFIAFTRVSPPRPRFSTILCKFAHNFFSFGCPGRSAPSHPLVTPLQNWTHFRHQCSLFLTCCIFLQNRKIRPVCF